MLDEREDPWRPHWLGDSALERAGNAPRRPPFDELRRLINRVTPENIESSFHRMNEIVDRSDRAQHAYLELMEERWHRWRPGEPLPIPPL